MHRTPPRASAITVVLVALALASGAASAQNLLINSSFDHNLTAWQMNPDGSASWDTLDAAGAAGSGSALITNYASGGNTYAGPLLQCVPVTPGTSYDFTTKVRIAPGQARTGHAMVQILWRNNSECTGSVGNSAAISGGTVGVWAELSRAGIVAPAGATRAMIQLGLVKEEAGASFVANFDDVGFQLTPGTCGDPATTLCLHGGRFRVSMTWQTASGQNGVGHVVPLSGDSGYFWFFDPSNAEVLTKLLDACSPPYNHFWFFAAGMTNVRVVITVEDLQAHVTKTYTNPQGTAFRPLQDTRAFATCP